MKGIDRIKQMVRAEMERKIKPVHPVYLVKWSFLVAAGRAAPLRLKKGRLTRTRKGAETQGKSLKNEI